MTEKPAKKIMGQSVPDERWLAQLHEAVIEPALPIVDAHHHLWVRNGHRYLLPEFIEDLETGHNIVATVYAECESMYRPGGPPIWRSLGETEFVTGCAAIAGSGVMGETKICQGLVGRVDLLQGAESRPVFERHLTVSGGRFKGVRFTAAWDETGKIPNPAPRAKMLAEAQVRAAARVMSELGLTLDLWVFHPQLAEVAALADALPELTIVLNHTGVPILGGPYRDRTDEVYRDWLRDMQALARRDNVVLKLGAFPIRRSGDGVNRSLPPDSTEIEVAWRPWMLPCIEAFGSARCMFESNFPVQKLFASYQVTWNAFKRIASGASAEQKQRLFQDTATRVYRLQEPLL